MVDLMVETKTIIFWNTHLYSSSVSSCINVLRSDGIMYAGLRVVNLCWVIGLGFCGEVVVRVGEMGKRGKGGKSWEEEKKKEKGTEKREARWVTKKVTKKVNKKVNKKQEKWQETGEGET